MELCVHPFLWTSLCKFVIERVVGIVSDGHYQSYCVFVEVVFESLHGGDNADVDAAKCTTYICS